MKIKCPGCGETIEVKVGRPVEYASDADRLAAKRKRTAAWARENRRKIKEKTK
jgi:hypothetical protein